MFLLPHLQPCDGLPLWLMGADDTTEALLLWWPSGTLWLIQPAPDNEHRGAA